jgi:large subunit ribosomal protein L22
MEVRAIARQQHISPMKVREVTREIQGLPVSRALDICHFTPKKAARLVGKTLKSAIANAEHNYELDVNALVVKTAVVGEGAHAERRHIARARGSSSIIRRRRSHITIILSDEIEIETRASRAEKKKKPTRSNKPKAGKKSSEASAEESSPATES